MSTLLYNPDRKNKTQLIEEFVVRTKIFDEIFADIKSSKMQYPEQSYLLIGQRGLGKTTLLTRLKYAIEDNPELHKQIIPVAFSEEQYNISELVNLWEEVAAYMEDYYGYSGIYKEMQAQAQKENYEQLAFDVLLRHLDQSKKKLVLLIDNIGVLLSKFEKIEINRLREVLQTKPHIRIIGGSTTPLESVTDYHQPLYEFFKVYQLKGLTLEESITLLKKLAAVHNETEKIERIIAERPGRVETIRTLSGGVPRTIAMLFQVFLDNEHGSSISDLERILDLVTPLYKHRMDDLPPQQQKIVDAVARNWDAVTVKELTERLRLDSKLISAQLKQLEKNQVIEKRRTDTKNHLYLLSERFFNIWYLMRYGRKDSRLRVIWLVKFLEVWCDEGEIEKRINNYVEKIKDGKLDEHTLKVYGEIYSFFENAKPGTKLSLKEATPEYISKEIKLNEKEVDELIKKAIEEKDWAQIVKIGIHNKLTNEQKRVVFPFNGPQVDLLLFIMTSINERYGTLHLATPPPPHFCISAFLYGVAVYLSGKENLKAIDLTDNIILAFIQQYKIYYESFDGFEIETVAYLFTRLLVLHLENKLMRIFEELAIVDKDIFDKYKLIYYIMLKLMNKSIDKLDNEMTEMVNKFADAIIVKRTEYKLLG